MNPTKYGRGKKTNKCIFILKEEMVTNKKLRDPKRVGEEKSKNKTRKHLRVLSDD